MGWATQKEVIQHYHMLTKKEAILRQVGVSSVIAAIATLTYFIFPLFHKVILCLTLPYYAFVLIDILLPNHKLAMSFQGKTQRIKTLQPPTSEPENAGDSGSNDSTGISNGVEPGVTQEKQAKETGEAPPSLLASIAARIAGGGKA